MAERRHGAGIGVAVGEVGRRGPFDLGRPQHVAESFGEVSERFGHLLVGEGDVDGTVGREIGEGVVVGGSDTPAVAAGRPEVAVLRTLRRRYGSASSVGPRPPAWPAGSLRTPR
ncbi:MAG: hypothetical protein R2697_21430 [Ilumatobacteraceae bacterium]